MSSLNPQQFRAFDPMDEHEKSWTLTGYNLSAQGSALNPSRARPGVVATRDNYSLFRYGMPTGDRQVRLRKDDPSLNLRPMQSVKALNYLSPPN